MQGTRNIDDLKVTLKRKYDHLRLRLKRSVNL